MCLNLVNIIVHMRCIAFKINLKYSRSRLFLIERKQCTMSGVVISLNSLALVGIFSSITMLIIDILVSVLLNDIDLYILSPNAPNFLFCINLRYPLNIYMTSMYSYPLYAVPYEIESL